MLSGDGARPTTALSKDESSPEAEAPIGTANGHGIPSIGIISHTIVEELVANAAFFAVDGENTVVAKDEAWPSPPRLAKRPAQTA